MKRGLAFVAVAIVAGGCASTPPVHDRGELIRRILGATVQLTSQREGGGRRAASGVVVATEATSRRAWIITVRHFVDPPRPQEIYARLAGAKSAARATIAGVSADIDLALLQVDDFDATPVRLKPIARLGDEILIIAFPWGEPFTVVRGTVSQLMSGDRETVVTGSALMVDASVSYGSSGGGVFDARSGEMIGIVESYRTAKMTIPDVPGRVLEFPVPGETTVIPAPAIARFIADSGVNAPPTK
jgi:serine protease Do